MTFRETKVKVLNRGSAPDSFLTELVQWGRSAPEDIFAPNDNTADIYALIKSRLATQQEDGKLAWGGILHRKAAMLESMRVHAGFESSWNWNKGVDVTNQTSLTHILGQETSIFQVSYDSLNFDKDRTLRACLLSHGVNPTEVKAFIAAMKSNHDLALEYYARLVRISIAWAGPLVRHEILPIIKVESMLEFMDLLQF